MSRAVLFYALLVVLPAAALSVFAFRLADGDYRERLGELRSGLAEEAAALARRVEGAVSDAFLKAEEEPPAGFAGVDGSIAYSPDPPPGEDASSFGTEELRYYNLSRRGGESYEFLRRDPARAIDAYAFYLPRIRSPLLRARLELGMARAALSEGSEAGRRLGEWLLRELSEDPGEAWTEEGLPIGLLAADRLHSRASGDEGLRAAARERLLRSEQRLSTPLFAGLAAAIAPGDPALEEVLAKRRALEAAVAAHPEVLTTRDAVLGDGFLLLGRTLPSSEPGKTVRALRLQRLDLPSLAAGDLSARLQGEAADPPGPACASHPIRLSEGGPPLAILELEDPRLAEKVAGLARRRDLHRGLVGLLVLSTLAGGIALVRYVSKERGLARLRSRLVANVSHELKSPVTSVRLFAEMLSDDRVEASRARRFVDHLRAESQRLSQLVENLLDLSRFSKEEAALPLEPVDLAALLGRLAEGFSFHAKDRKVAFETGGLLAGGAAGPVEVETNAQAVERIVRNLLDNALKYRREDKPEVRLELAMDGGRARISVTDNGPGIPRADRERVFEEFYRLRYDDYGVKGSGLGLSIARRLARKLGGDVTLVSREGGGSRFTLEIPRSRTST